MTRRSLIAGNWKMNCSLSQARQLAFEIAAGAPSELDLLICPPFPWLEAVKMSLAGSTVLLGAQNCWVESSGAFTGEVAPEMIAEFCSHVIIGHSERRTLIGESDELVAKKVRAALRTSLESILCVGESLETRKAGHAEAFVAGQLHSALNDLSAVELKRCTIAYEPIWAIGTGASATLHDIETMSSFIRSTLDSMGSRLGAAVDSTRILYGGSVTPANFSAICKLPNIDGALVGGASLKPDTFLDLATIALN